MVSQPLPKGLYKTTKEWREEQRLLFLELKKTKDFKKWRANQKKMQEGLCAYCREALPGMYHVDHFIPIYFGGKNEYNNFLLSCPSCNEIKRFI